jgi:hypothetical protein
MSVNMPAWDSDVNFCCWVDLHVLRKVGHASPKILRPLTTDVIRNENPGEYDPNQCRKDDEIHTTIPKDKGISY